MQKAHVSCRDLNAALGDNRCMSSKSKQQPQKAASDGDPDWYFKEWAAHLGIRFPHAWLVREMVWSDGKASNVISGKKRYDRDIINKVSEKLGIKPYMLLMSPEQATALQAQRDASAKIVALEHS